MLTKVSRSATYPANATSALASAVGQRVSLAMQVLMVATVAPPVYFRGSPLGWPITVMAVPAASAAPFRVAAAIEDRSPSVVRVGNVNVVPVSSVHAPSPAAVIVASAKS